MKVMLLFDELGYETLQPFPLIHQDPIRRQIDDTVIEALGLDADWVSTMRRELAREPSVTNRRVALGGREG